MVSQITSNSTVCSTVFSVWPQSPCYWPYVRGIHRWPVDSPHKGSVTRKTFPFHDVIVMMASRYWELFRITGPLIGESTGNLLMPSQKASSGAFVFSLFCYPEQAFQQTLECPVIWEAMTLMLRRPNTHWWRVIPWLMRYDAYACVLRVE